MEDGIKIKNCIECSKILISIILGRLRRSNIVYFSSRSQRNRETLVDWAEFTGWRRLEKEFLFYVCLGRARNLAEINNCLPHFAVLNLGTNHVLVIIQVQCTLLSFGEIKFDWYVAGLPLYLLLQIKISGNNPGCGGIIRAHFGFEGALVDLVTQHGIVRASCMLMLFDICTHTQLIEALVIAIIKNILGWKYLIDPSWVKLLYPLWYLHYLVKCLLVRLKRLSFGLHCCGRIKICANLLLEHWGYWFDLLVENVYLLKYHLCILFTSLRAQHLVEVVLVHFATQQIHHLALVFVNKSCICSRILTIYALTIIVI